MRTLGIFHKINQAARALLILAFVVLLWLPALDKMFQLDATPPPNENRYFATFPEFTGLARSKAFIGGVEAYFNDHFGFRRRLVTWNNEWKHKLFQEAPFSSVISGRDGWLFLASYQMVEHYTGLSRFTSEDLSTWQKLLEARRDWLAQFGIKYLFVIPPDKHTIYPEHLPPWLKQSHRPSKLDQFAEHMKTHSTVEVLDLRAVLLAAKQSEMIYPMTDTHWNSLGAFVACQELIKTLSRQLPELRPMPLDAFDRQPLPDQQGDLARLAGESRLEPKQFTLTPRPPLQPLQQTTGKSVPQKRWPQPDPVITQNQNANGNAIVFRDSFGDNLIPFLGHHFGQVVYVWRPDWDFEFIEREKPVVVIDEMLERSFNTQNPANLLRGHLEATRSSAKVSTGN